MEVGKRLRWVEGRCAAAPVVLPKASSISESLHRRSGFGNEAVKVGVSQAPVAGHHDMAGTKRAPVLAEGQVDVQREWVVRSGRCVSQTGSMFLRAKALMEVDGCRIRGVTGSGPVVPGKKLSGGFDHVGRSRFPPSHETVNWRLSALITWNATPSSLWKVNAGASTSSAENPGLNGEQPNPTVVHRVQLLRIRDQCLR